MHETVSQPTDRALAIRAPEQATIPTESDELESLFAFMAEAELRFDSLRMRIVDREYTTHGEEVVSHDVWLRHPGAAKVVSTRGEGAEGDYDVWVSDGTTVRTLSALHGTTTRRPLPRPPAGTQDPDLPAFSRIHPVQTALPAETVVDTFVHPHGFCRNVLATGPVYRRGTAEIAGREAILLRCDHPRTSHVLLDRPDHWLEVGVDIQTGMLLLLAEHVGERMTRHAQATSVRLDETIPDSAFMVHVSADTRTVY